MKKIDSRPEIRAVTSNNFITACGLDDFSLKARKLLYLAISQCKKSDNDFYEYEISVSDFARIINIVPNAIYKTADELTNELMRGIIRVENKSGTKWTKYSLFSKCEYTQDGMISFKLNPDMTSLLLGLKKNFTQPLLADFMQMNSTYSIEVWHLMQREMNSKKPGISNMIEFDLSLEELRKVTGTKNKLKQLSEFKNRVLDKAIREILECCGVDITYTNLKRSRTVIGFHFKAVSVFHIDEADAIACRARYIKKIDKEMQKEFSFG